MKLSFSSVSEIDWPSWEPQQRATLLFVIEPERMLLIHKKRGLGAGKINAPGGRIEPGETPIQAAARETQEEIGIEPLNVAFCGELSFQFLDGLSLYCQVFRASSYRGLLRETDEATPLWVPLDNIPYDHMWQDDRLWVPIMLKKQPFQGFFIFDDHRMVDHYLKTNLS